MPPLKKSNVNDHMSNVARVVRVRLAPSPTGPFHIGTARTALFNWLFARQNGGEFILRIEDTDKERSDKKWEKEIIEGLKWLDLDWDGEIHRQSDRGEIYKKYLEKLLNDGHAYYCYCAKEDLEAERQAMIAQGLPAKYGGHCRIYADSSLFVQKVRDGQRADINGKSPQVIRFKTPEAIVEFKDIIRGAVKFDASLFGDMVIAKDLDTPLYNFAAVIDDEEMKITHVIRGEDHLSNTPKQILVQKALGFGEIEYAHLPLILNSDKSKLSKRFVETSFLDYKNSGYLPEAMINFLALLGWHPKEDKEFLTKEELLKEFDLRRAQKAGAVFNPEKLDWLQKEHMKNLSSSEIAERAKPFFEKSGISAAPEFLEKVVELEKSRVKTIKELPDATGFFFNLPDYGSEILAWNSMPLDSVKIILLEILEAINSIKNGYFDKESILRAVSTISEKKGKGAVFWPLRVALSGSKTSPDPIDISCVLGLDETKRRLELAISKINESR